MNKISDLVKITTYCSCCYNFKVTSVTEPNYKAMLG